MERAEKKMVEINLGWKFHACQMASHLEMVKTRINL